MSFVFYLFYLSLFLFAYKFFFLPLFFFFSFSSNFLFLYAEFQITVFPNSFPKFFVFLTVEIICQIFVSREMFRRGCWRVAAGCGGRPPVFTTALRPSAGTFHFEKFIFSFFGRMIKRLIFFFFLTKKISSCDGVVAGRTRPRCAWALRR